MLILFAACNILTHIVFITVPSGKYYYYPYFMGLGKEPKV